MGDNTNVKCHAAININISLILGHIEKMERFSEWDKGKIDRQSEYM